MADINVFNPPSGQQTAAPAASDRFSIGMAGTFLAKYFTWTSFLSWLLPYFVVNASSGTSMKIYTGKLAKATSTIITITESEVYGLSLMVENPGGGWNTPTSVDGFSVEWNSSGDISVTQYDVSLQEANYRLLIFSGTP